MADPTTVNRALIIPARGADVGTWDTPVVADMTSIDGMFGGAATISLTNAPVTLTVPAGFTATPSAGPTQSQNAIIKFTGTLTGNCQITIPMPGYYIFDNRCTVGAFVVQLTSGVGELISLPPGCPVHVYADGTNVRFVNLPAIGTFMDLCGVSATPAWITQCTVAPWLICDGTVYNISAFPFLGTQLGATFGGNGSTTFGVPDLRGKWRVSLDPTLTRLTSATMSPNGNTLAATGGAQNQILVAGQMPLQTTGTDSVDHVHNLTVSNVSATFGSGTFAGGAAPTAINTGIESVAHTHNVGNASPAAVTTLPPVVITGITLIRAG